MLYLAYEHAGFKLMQKVKEYLNKKGIKFVDCGPKTEVSTDSWADYALPTNELIAKSKANKGIYCCGAGIGMAMAANRHKKIRAAVCYEVEHARIARFHNDINVLVLPGRYITIKKAGPIIDKFLIQEFEGGRHISRIKQIS